MLAMNRKKRRKEKINASYTYNDDKMDETEKKRKTINRWYLRRLGERY